MKGFVIMNENRVLVVDDERGIISLLELYLIENGFDVIAATSGKEALAKVEQETPDIVVLDVLMMDMSGFLVCREIRKSQKYMPIIFLSSLRDSESIIKGLEVGGDDYLTKPFDPLELIARINVLLRRTL